MIVRAIDGRYLGHPFFFLIEKTAMATAVASVQTHTIRILCMSVDQNSGNG